MFNVKYSMLNVLFLFLIGNAAGVEEEPDTSLWLKYKILPKEELFKVRREYFFPIKDIFGKEKIYTRHIAAAPIGGLRREPYIEFEEIKLEKKLKLPVLSKRLFIKTTLPTKPTEVAEEPEIQEPTKEARLERLNLLEAEIKESQIESGKKIVQGIESLGIKSLQTPPLLLKEIREEKTAMKIAAIKALGEVEEKGSIPLLQEALKEPSVKHEAAFALAKMGDTTALATLHIALEERETPKKIETIKVLGRIGDIASVPFLRKLLLDEDWSVRCNAALALAKIGDEGGLKFLHKALAEEGSDKRIEAALKLADIGDKTGIPELKLALNDTLSAIRIAAIKSLGNVGDESVIPLLDEIMKKDPELRVRVIASESVLKISKRRHQ